MHRRLRSLRLPAPDSQFHRFYLALGLMLLLVCWLASGRLLQAAEDDNRQVIRVTAASEPLPAMRYRFWPPPEEQSSKNAAPFFSRAVLWLGERSAGNSILTAEQYQRWMDARWDDQTIDEIDTFLRPYGFAFSELERLRTRMGVDYPLDLDDFPPVEALGVLLPEVQQSRTLGRLLALRAKREAHRGNWDQFANTVQTIFRLGDVVGKTGDSLVQQLVCLSIADIGFDAVERASRMAGAPNFYWALAAVPESLCDLRRSIDYESGLALATLGDALPDDRLIGAAESRVRLRELFGVLDQLFAYKDVGPWDDNMGIVIGTLSVLGGADSARRVLQSTESWRGRVDQLSNAETILRATHIQVRQLSDEVFKWSHLPRHLRKDYLKRATSTLESDSIARQLEPAGALLGLLTPALHSVENALQRFLKNRARSITLQAIRMTAAQHGQLPESLEELMLPAWPDPISGDSPSYVRLAPNTARITMKPAHDGTEDSYSLELIK